MAPGERLVQTCKDSYRLTKNRASSSHSKPEARVIADLGCGDAEIAGALGAASGASGASTASGNQKDGRRGNNNNNDNDTNNTNKNTNNNNKNNKKKQCRTVHNFDLCQNSRGNVTVCNIADVPLPDRSVDACVFCLSLMGTDYGAFLTEAARILRDGGHLWIAEVTSRAVQRAEGFDVVPDLVAAIESLGFSCVSKRVEDGSYFFELVFASDARQRKNGFVFPALRACAYKKR
jgi:SAM-dependent methyltransferase